MSAEESRGVVLNTKTLSAIIAGLILLGMFWTGSTRVNNQVHKIDLLDRRVTQIEESQKKDLELAEVRGERILTKVEALQKDVQALTKALTKVDAHRRGDLRQAAAGEGTARDRRPPVRLIQSLSNGTMDDDTLNKRTLIFMGSFHRESTVCHLRRLWSIRPKLTDEGIGIDPVCQSELVIFDYNGVLIDSQATQCPIDVRELTDPGFPVTPSDLAHAFFGHTTRDVIDHVEQVVGRALPDSFEARRDQLVMVLTRTLAQASWEFSGSLTCYPFLDHLAGGHPASTGGGGPCAADRFTSDIGGLLPMALWGRTSL